MNTVLVEGETRQAERKTSIAASKWKKYKRAALFGVPIFIVIAVAALLPPRVAVVSPVPMSLRDEAVGTGFIKAKVLVGVGAKINGVVLKTYVDQGDPVRKGQVLAELQNNDVQNQIELADSQFAAQKSAVATAQANLAASQARLQGAISTVEKSKAALRLADINFKRAKELYAAGVYSREAFDSAETTYDQAAREVDNSEALRQASEQEVSAARSDFSAAQKNVAGSVAGVNVQRANLEYTILRSPVDGYVVSRDLEQGATVVPGLPVFTVAESSVIWVSANIDEREVSGLRVGQAATITLRSNPHRKISGKVARIAQQADPVTEEVVVDVAFIAPPSDLKLNETAEVTILKSEKAEAASVPATAVLRTSDGPSVWAVRDGRLRLQRVSVGIRDKRGVTEIQDGLGREDLIVANPTATGIDLAPGARVRTSMIKLTGASR